MKRREIVSGAEAFKLHERPDADLLLMKPLHRHAMDFDVAVIRFASRAALEAFNKKAGLRPAVFTMVKKNCAVWAHEKETRP